VTEPWPLPPARRRRPVIRLRGNLRRTSAVIVACVLACCYALVLAGFGIYFLILFANHQGAIGNQARYFANRGVSEVIGLFIRAIATLVFGEVRAWRGTRGLQIIVPLAVIVLVGAIGEPIDISNGNSATDNLIGSGILLLAITPIVLLALPRGCRPVSTN